MPPETKRSELSTRIIFGLIAAAIAGVAVYIGGYAFYFFIGILSFLASLEFDRLRGDGKACFLFCALPILLSTYPLIAVMAVVMAMLLVIVIQHSAKTYFTWLVISIPYISLPAIALIWTSTQDGGMRAVIWLVLVIVATDTGAYFAGKKFGKNKLAPAISPKKTWEGLAGGVIAASIVSFIFTGGFLFALAGAVFAVIGQVSDLMESAIKRNFDVKDAGKLIPGHGGVMDRTDGFVLTAPLLAIAMFQGWFTW